MFGKSPNNIPFVLKRKFTLSTRHSSLSVSALKKNTRLTPRVHTVHIHVIQIEIRNEEAHILAVVLDYHSYRLSLFSLPEKKQTTSRDDADMYPLNILVRTPSSASSKNIQSKSG